MEVRFGAQTDVGLVREHNEDVWHAAPPLFVVADGMGGHQGGDVAARLAVEALAALRPPRAVAPGEAAEMLTGALAAAHEAINDYARGRQLEGHRGFYAGTTAVAALLVAGDDGPAWLVANVGDSRAYASSAEGLFQITVDHSRVQELVESGTITREQMSSHPERNVVTRGLGGPTLAEPDFFLVALGDCHRLLLCSDGVSGLLTDEELADVLATAPDVQAAADRLVAGALAAGGTDNATAVVIEAG